MNPSIPANGVTVATAAVSTHGVLVATAEALPGFRIHKVLGEVLGVAARTLNPFREGFRNLYDGGACNDEDRLEILVRCRMEAVERMRTAAWELGGNAVIAMRFDHRQVTDVSNEVCAYGTAVVVSVLPHM